VLLGHKSSRWGTNFCCKVSLGASTAALATDLRLERMLRLHKCRSERAMTGIRGARGTRQKGCCVQQRMTNEHPATVSMAMRCSKMAGSSGTAADATTTLIYVKDVIPQNVICPKRVGDRVCEYMHARAIPNVLAQGRTLQKDGSNPPNLPEIHTLKSCIPRTRRADSSIWGPEDPNSRSATFQVGPGH